MKTIVFTLFLLGSTVYLHAEGTKDLIPGTGVPSPGNPVTIASGCMSKIQGNDGTGKEGPTLGRPDYDMVKVYVSDTTERIFFGFRDDGSSGDVNYYILSPSGATVKSGPVLSSAGTGYIADNQIEAYAGPLQIAGAGSGGYDADYIIPTETGEYIIKFERVSGNKYYIHPFDVTIGEPDGSGGFDAVDGRLYSQKWHLSATSSSGKGCMTFYTYTPDSMVVAMDMNEIQPYGYSVSFNSFGCEDGGDLEADRQSRSSNGDFHEYNVFLNEPDVNVWPTPQPMEVEVNNLYGCEEEEYNIYITCGHKTQFNIYLDLDSTGAYESGGVDVLKIIDNEAPGTFLVSWDGRNGLGATATPGQQVNVIVHAKAGLVHFPIWDAENHTNGFNASIIRPGYYDAPLLFFDNSNVSGGSNLTGCTSGCNTWSSNYGDNKLINTWMYTLGDQDTVGFRTATICDTDGDGIADADDYDDDNDGIPDSQEGCSLTYRFDVSSEGWFSLNDNSMSKIESNPASHSSDGTTNNSGCTISTSGASNANIAGASPTNSNYIVEDDPSGGIMYLRSPSLGGMDQSPLEGGTLTYDAYTYRVGFTGDPGWLAGTEVIVQMGNTTSGTMTYSRAVTSAELTNWENGIWNTFEIPMNHTDWGETNGDFLAVLSDLDFISIRMEHISGGNTSNCGDTEYYAMDNIILNPVSAEDCADTDGDGIPNSKDLDSDNDGIPDLVEVGGVDSNGDGMIDYPTPGDPTSMVDLDGDGLADAYDDTDNIGSTPGWTNGTNLYPSDADGDEIPDFLDLDSDNDGITDLVEAGGVDANGDGKVDNTTDLDSDGFADVYDPDDNGASGIDSGEANTPLVKTTDSNADGLADAITSGEGTDLDADGDGIADFLDLDSDNDGIPDLVEAGGIDTDGDGLVDNTTDADNDGYADIYDTDDDGTAGVEDANDALVQTGGEDTDGDGKADDEAITFVDGDGNSSDADGDGIPDFVDLDSDNDGIPDLVEAGGIDNNGDGRVDTATDADGDGFADIYDTDDDGTPGVEDTNDALVQTGGTDTDGDGKADDAAIVWERGDNTDLDTDGDGIPDFLDLDADNDGIPDLIEAGGIDATGDGRVDNATDADGDGLADAYDADASDGPAGSGSNGSVLVQTSGTDTGSDGIADGDAAISYTNGSGNGLPDIDGDGIPNAVDLDADNDGILDVTEAGATDANGDGIVDGSTDADGDGLLDVYDPAASDGPAGTGTDGSPLMTVATDDTEDADTRGEYANGAGTGDSDGDDVPNFLDVDADNDGIFDLYEAQTTTGYTPPAGTDADGDGIDDAFDDDDAGWGGAGAAGLMPVNTDSGTGDTTPDYLDTDSDGDNVTDMQEAWDSLDDGDSQPDGVTGSCTVDADGDGLVDCFDSNDADATVSTISTTPPTDDGSGGSGTTSSTGVNLANSNEMDDIFPANDLNGGANSAEPDYRDTDNVACATAQVWYAVTEGDTTNDYHYNPGTQKHALNANTAIVRATAYCETAGGWFRFYNPLQPDKYILSIQNNTNTRPLSEVIDYVEVKSVEDVVREQSGGEGAVYMRRAWFISAKDTLNGTVNVRFYYPKSEWDALQDSATDLASDVGGSAGYRWYKTDDAVDYSNLPTKFAGFANNFVNLNDNLNGENPAGGDTQTGGASKNYVQFDGLSSFSGGTFGAEASTTLPVELLDLRAEWMDNQAVISWVTATEQNSDYFQVEKSVNGQSFSPIGRVDAAGNSISARAYQLTDPDMGASKAQYRIRSFDLDAQEAVSRVVELRLAEAENSFQIAPNPGNRVIFINFSSDVQQTGQIDFFDQQGKIVRSHLISLVPQNGPISLEISDLPRGIYQVRLTSNQGQHITRFLKN
ncbi:MAG: T9SS type A sorting domain-containing protein [Bacteroidota bacterium]